LSSAAAPGRAEAVAKQCESTTAASSLAELAEACSVVVTMLPNTSHVEAVYSDADSGLLRWAQPDTLFIDSSTISPIASRAVASRAQAAGHCMIDAPVSGGVPAAQAGTLTFIVGGDSPAVQRATPLLQAMGRSIVHCGASGSGCIAKLANNLALAISMVGISEAMNLGVKLGMEPKTLAHVLNTSTARCWSSDTYNPYPGEQLQLVNATEESQ
jgi:3-hydroxyisobutyrate dehydrogenase